MKRTIILSMLALVSSLVVYPWAGASGRGTTDQERCYLESLEKQRERASGLDWERTPAREKLDLLEAGLELIPDCAYVHYLRGLVLDVGLSEPTEALKSFEKAVSIAPTFDLAHENIAHVYLASVHRSFNNPELRPNTEDEIFQLTRALATINLASQEVAGNPLWGRERSDHLRDLGKAVERELDELRSPKGNGDFLSEGLKVLKVVKWKANIREGFGLGHPSLVTLNRGETLKAAAGHSRYGWIKVLLDDGRPGWVFHDLLE